MGALFRVFLVTLAFSTGTPLFAAQEIDSEPLNIQEANWSPSLETGDIIFPSLILATRNFDANAITGKATSPYYVGDPTGIFGVKFINTATNTKVRVSVMIDGLSEESSLEAVLPEAGQEYKIMPHLRYKSDALSGVKQPYSTTAVFSVSINGAPPQQMVKSLNIRTINDAPFAMQQGDNLLNLSVVFAAYVNENAPVIDEILKDAMHHRAVMAFTGYSKNNKQDFIRQIFGIWNSLQRHDVRYSSITPPSGESKIFYSQHVRMPDESFADQQANCVDGTVLIASALYRIGMCPVMIAIPGHMFLGVYDNQESCDKHNFKDLVFIETTAIGNIPPLNRIQKNWEFKTDNGYLNSLSYKSLMLAIKKGEKHRPAIQSALRNNKPGYYLWDVKQLRELGITPIKSSK